MRLSLPLLVMMALAALGALFLPPTSGESLRALTGALFLPIASPVRQIAGNVDGRLVKSKVPPSIRNTAARSNQQLVDEIESLRYQVAFLKDNVDKLNQQLNEIGHIDSKSPMRYVQVIGGDVGVQQVLLLQLPSSEGLAHNTPVLYPKGQSTGLAGKLEIIGIGAARVRLVTDRASAITCGFRRYQKDSSPPFIDLPQTLKTAEGAGNGTMMIRAMKRDEATPKKADLRLMVGDWVVAIDKDLGPAGQKQKLGEIESINVGKNPLFVDIVVRPDVDLMKLHEVLIPVKKP